MDIDRRILQLALPAIVSNITVPLLGLSDTAIAGHLGAEHYLAAIGVGATMMNLSAWLFGFLRMGTAGISATSYGRGDTEALSRLFCRTLLMAFAIGALMIVVRHPLADMLTGVIDPGENIAREAEGYYVISIYAAPAQLATMAMSGWMVGMQSTFWPMVVSIVTNLVNIPLSLALVFGFGVGFPGLAIGTAAAQWAGFVFALCISLRLWRKRISADTSIVGKSLFSEMGSVFRRGGSAGFLTVNGSLFFRSACVMAVSVGMTSFAGSMGETALAANAVLMQFFTFFSFFMDGFAHAAEALIGKAVGRRRIDEVRLATRHLLLWSAGVALFFMMFYSFAGMSLSGLFTDSRRVVDCIWDIRWVFVALPPLAVGAFIFDGLYIGLTRTGAMFWATLLSGLFFFILNILLGVRGGLAILWTGFMGYLFLRGALLGARYPAELHKIKQL